MTSILYDSLRHALDSKKCHFCGKPMEPNTRGFFTEFEIRDDILISEDYRVLLDRETSYGPDLRTNEVKVFGFQCPEHLYRSDITLEYSNYNSTFLPQCVEEEILLFDDTKAYHVTNYLDRGKTRIYTMSKALVQKSFGKTEINIMDELNYDHNHNLEFDLIQFPQTTEELLKKIKVYLTFY